MIFNSISIVTMLSVSICQVVYHNSISFLLQVFVFPVLCSSSCFPCFNCLHVSSSSCNVLCLGSSSLLSFSQSCQSLALLLRVESSPCCHPQSLFFLFWVEAILGRILLLLSWFILPSSKGLSSDNIISAWVKEVNLVWWQGGEGRVYMLVLVTIATNHHKQLVKTTCICFFRAQGQKLKIKVLVVCSPSGLLGENPALLPPSGGSR